MTSILIAEGDRSVARLFAAVLEQQNWKVISLHEASRVVEELRGTERYDLLIVSYEVAGSNGVALIELARKLPHRKSLPIVMVTGTSGIDRLALAAGASEVLNKPIGIHELVAVSRRRMAEAECQRVGC